MFHLLHTFWQWFLMLFTLEACGFAPAGLLLLFVAFFWRDYYCFHSMAVSFWSWERRRRRAECSAGGGFIPRILAHEPLASLELRF
ncbi:hypothetical protein V8C26DRAFT_383039 [Trichoderma gracile]